MSTHNASSKFVLDEPFVRQELERMEADTALYTDSAYSPNTALYPDNRMPFADKHILYLKTHPKLDPRMYLSNLRLMIRK